jgi:3'-phosphoadenosine 5'-phosphosulfate sulfotransferase (PAPS reductase)/FAD synthetase
MKKHLNIVSVSGGKDSTALYLLCMEYLGNDFLPIFADTGHEHPVTINYVKNLHYMTGGPEVIIVKPDFSKAIERKRLRLLQSAEDAQSQEEREMYLRRAEKCKPTGNGMHDLLIWKGRSPSTKAQFCTENLKLWPILFYLEKHYPKSEWDWEMFTGIRAGESLSRSKKQPWMWNSFYDCMNVMPLLYEIEETVFYLHHKNNIMPNPLYTMGGASRVGCYPCIHSNKNELLHMENWAWERLKTYEESIGRTWFAPDQIPSGSPDQLPTVDQVKNWVQTSRGGKQFNMFLQAEFDNKKEIPSCMTGFMKCE